jgi:hypothetical protein
MYLEVIIVSQEDFLQVKITIVMMFSNLMKPLPLLMQETKWLILLTWSKKDIGLIVDKIFSFRWAVILPSKMQKVNFRPLKKLLNI